MKLKEAVIVLEKIEITKKRWLKALKGKPPTKYSGSENIIVGSAEMLAQVFSRSRIEILKSILTLKPKSVYELAKLLKKDYKNIYQDVRFLADLGLIELKKQGARKTLVPIARFKSITLPLTG
jgi:predicted transcriptional regulator